MITSFLVPFVVTVSVVTGGGLFSSNPATKIWLPDTNFWTSSNWEDGKLPCSNQRVVFPSVMSVSVFLQSNASIREMVLPMDGEIAFGSNVQLAIGVSNTAQLNCPVKDARFKLLQASNWYSPQSWGIKNEALENPAPVPEAERVPCQNDHVIFQTNTSFKAKLDGPPISISSLTIAEQMLNSSSFEALAITASGKLHFQKLTTVDINQLTCTDVTGCVCRNNKVQATVCALTKCPAVDCSDPVKPVGSCCALCGSIVTTKYASGFLWANLHKLYSSFLAKAEYQTVQGYMSKISDDLVQVVFTDNTASHRSTQLAVEIKDYVESDINGLQTLEILSVSAQTSSHWIAHSLIHEGMSIGSVMGIVFGFIAIAALALTALALYRTRCVINLPFGRLYDEFKEGGAVHFDATLESEDFPTLQRPLSNIEGFDNPMYQTPSAQPPSYEDTSFGPGSSGTVEIRQNPAFMAFGEDDDEQ